MGEVDFSAMAKACRQYDPDLWARCCPRRYAGADGYRSFDLPAVSMFSTLRIPEELGRFPDESSRTIFRIDRHLIDLNVPTLFVAPEFGRAVMETEPPAEILWTEARLPHEAAILMLPDGLIPDPAGVSLPFVAYSRMKAGDVYREIDRELAVASDILSIHALTSLRGPAGTNITYEMTLNSANARQANIRDLHYDRVLSAGEDEWLTDVARFVLKVALVVEERPSLLGKSELLRKPRKGKDALWSPNVIGKAFRILREPPTAETATARAGVRTHWRRGHFRNQAHGEGRAQRKIIWIQPVLVG